VVFDLRTVKTTLTFGEIVMVKSLCGAVALLNTFGSSPMFWRMSEGWIETGPILRSELS